MSEELDLSLPREAPVPARSSWGVPVLLAVILVGLAANMVLTVARPSSAGTRAKAPNALAAEPLKLLALKLEKQGLRKAAAEAWRDYLGVAPMATEEAAKIWYRIGKLHQDARDYESALDAYYRSESFAGVPELASEISRRTEQCLESMGKFAALRYELAERVGLDSTTNAAGAAVVAEIGPRRITTAELDGMIEADIQRQLSRYASFLPPDQVNRQKEEMLKQFSTSSQRKAFLHRYILQELLSRKARETGLTEDADVQAVLEEQERDILAQQMIEKQYADQIKITAGDIQTYYEAHRNDYKRAERAGISHILVPTETEAKATLDRALGDEDFAELAGELSKDDTTREKGGKLSGWAEKDCSIPGIGYAAGARALIFSTEPGHVCTNFVKSTEGYHIIKVREREPEAQKSYEEVQQEVFQALRKQKELEVQQRLMAELESGYNVVIHESAFAPDPPTATVPSSKP